MLQIWYYPFAKKSQRRSSPEKMHLKVIDFLDQIPERVATILCTFMETLYGIYGLLGLAKINSMEFLEVKLLTENPCKGWKIEYFPKVEGLLIQKRGNISIRCLVYSQELHWCLVAERFLVCQR